MHRVSVKHAFEADGGEVCEGRGVEILSRHQCKSICLLFLLVGPGTIVVVFNSGLGAQPSEVYLPYNNSEFVARELDIKALCAWQLEIV
jgi:hypothetical protein